MSIYDILKGLYFIGLFFACQNSNSQTTVTAGFNQDSIIIGDIATYTVTIKTNSNSRVLGVNGIGLDSIISGYQTQLAAQQDSLQRPNPKKSDYEILDWGKWGEKDENGFWRDDQLAFDTTALGGDLLLENTIQIRFWEPGMQFVSDPPVYLTTPDSTGLIQPYGQAEIMVAPPFDMAELEQANQDSIDISPIKPIIKEGKNISDYYWIFYTIGSLILLGLLWYLYLRNKKKQNEIIPEPVIVKRPAHIIAIEKLDILDDAKLWQKGQIKEFQSELTFIIREYLENRYDMPALESTTDEITSALRKRDFNKEDETDLQNILQIADLVKFAKATPAEELHQQFLDKAYTFVKKTKMVKVENIDNQTL